MFTRTRHIWECKVPNGKYRVRLSIGDGSHEQPGQNVRIEGTVLATNHGTAASAFAELEAEVTVKDGRLTLVIGKPEDGSNTTVNWLLASPIGE